MSLGHRRAKTYSVGRVGLAMWLCVVTATAAGCSSAVRNEGVPSTIAPRSTSTSVEVIHDELVVVKAGPAVQLDINPASAMVGDRVMIGLARPGHELRFVWAGRFIDDKIVHWEWAMDPTGDLDGPITPDNQPTIPEVVEAGTVICGYDADGNGELDDLCPAPRPIGLWNESYALPVDMIPGDWLICANGQRICGALTVAASK